jgi:hypothetical protein
LIFKVVPLNYTDYAASTLDEPIRFPSSRRAESPEVTEGGAARRGSEREARGQASGRARIRASRTPVRPKAADPEHSGERRSLIIGG